MSAFGHSDSPPAWNWRVALFAVAVFFVALGLGHYRADFAFFYHTDEPTKARQILDNERNYYHPLLLLNSAGLIYQLEGRPPSLQAAIESGRLASALFSAAALSLVVVVCFLNAGWLAAGLCALALLLESSLFEFAHYFKEDPAMNFGLALLCLAATFYERRATLPMAALLGVAVGFATSGKYIGILCLPFALWVLLGAASTRSPRWPALVVFVLSLLATLAVVNWQIFSELGTLLAGFQSEMGRVQDRYEESGSFHDKAFQRISIAFTPLVGFLLVAYLISPLYRRRVLSIAQWIYIGLPAAFALLLLSASRTGGRYNSPITLLAFLVAFIAAGWIIAAIAARFPRHARWVRPLAASVLAVLVLFTEAPKFSEYWTNLGFDSRLVLMRYVEKNLPPSACLAEEYDAHLPDPSKPDRFWPGLDLPQRRIVTKYKQLLPDLGTLQFLRQQGVTHIALVWSNEKKRLSRTGPEKWDKLSSEDRADAMFYYQLAQEGRVLWECRGGAPDHVRPPLRLYEISSISAP